LSYSRKLCEIHIISAVFLDYRSHIRGTLPARSVIKRIQDALLDGTLPLEGLEKHVLEAERCRDLVLLIVVVMRIIITVDLIVWCI